MFLENCICVSSSDIPTNTGILPVMEFLDSDHVLVKYIASFDIPDFSQVTTVAVYVGDKFYGKASSDYTKADNDRYEDSFFQPLEENSTIKAKLDPCIQRSFYVRITFLIGPSYLDSVNVYEPNTFVQVSLVANHN